MTASTRSDLLFAALAGAVTYGLAGPIPAVVVGVVAMLVAVGWRGPVDMLRRGAAAAWDGLRDVGAVRGASVGLRWLAVVFLAGVIVGRGGFALPSIVLPDIDWPVIVVPDIVTPAPPAPITEPGLSVMIVREATGKGLTPAQVSAIDSGEFADYLASHNARWRKFDRDVRPDMEAEVWRTAWATHVEGKPTEAFPMLIVSNGKTGVVEKLPADLAGLMSAVKKIGGE